MNEYYNVSYEYMSLSIRNMFFFSAIVQAINKDGTHTTMREHLYVPNSHLKLSKMSLLKKL